MTGGSSGSGVGIARRFAEEGADVVLMARAKERLERVAGEIGPAALPVVVDVSDPQSVEGAFDEVGERFGRLDILINNAALYRPCAVEKLTGVDIDAQIGTNLKGPIHTCRAAIPLLRAAGGGDIINTSSETTLHPFPMLSMYVATKAALEAFTKVLAMEVASDGIRVTNLIQGTARAASIGSTDWAWDPDHAAEAHALWEKMGLLNFALGQLEGQEVDAIGDVHLFIATRPRTQKLDTVHCRSF
ncbi:MAG TPA: SDR family oxidoreductase [Acidimicrobiales bacterium]|nr:SDR family oxidoreductase [Acidimicrobiales bacterium]